MTAAPAPIPTPALDAPVAAFAGLRVRGLWIAVGFAALMAVVGVMARPVLPVDETRYLTVAWEMRLSHDWLVPHLNGQPYSHKPPMLFWLINLAWALFGENPVVARLTPAAFLPLTVLLTGVLAERLGGRAAADRAALISVSFVVFAMMSSAVMFDAMLCAACVAALIGLTLSVEKHRLAGFALFGAMVGAGLLIKGPAVLIPLLPAAVLAPLWAERRGGWAGYYGGLVLALLLGAGIGLGWALPAARAGGAQFGQMILWGQTAGRMVKAFDHARPIWFFAALAPALFLPWTVSANLWAGLLRKARPSAPARPVDRLAWIVAGGVFLIFSLISGKQAHYLAPAMPALAVGVGAVLGRRDRLSPEPGFALVVAACGVLLLFAGPLGAAGPDPAPALSVAGLAVLAAGLLVWRARGRPELAAALTSAAIFGGVHLFGALGGLSVQRAEWINSWLVQGRPVAYVGDYAGQFGYAARLLRPVDVIEPAAVAAWLDSHPGGVAIQPYKETSSIGRPATESHRYRGGWLGIWVSRSPAAEPVDAPAAR